MAGRGAGPRAGLTWGLVGVVAFSFTVPLTRVATGGMSPLLIGAGRAVVAAVLAAGVLALARQPRPRGAQWGRLAVVAAGVVLGFPLLTSFALVTAPASHAAVVIALLPAATAVAVVLRTRERPPPAFWAAALCGAAAAVLFASLRGARLEAPGAADLLLIGAVLAAAVGYAEGGLLARELGAWQTTSWALVLAAPVTAGLTAAAVIDQQPSATGREWAAFTYLAAVSAFLGFFAWYRGLAIGPMARVSQVQLLQPVLTLVWAWALLGEGLEAGTVLGALVVVACAAGAVRARGPGASGRASGPASGPVVGAEGGGRAAPAARP